MSLKMAFNIIAIPIQEITVTKKKLPIEIVSNE